ncbi:unnamed protein product [Discula destructiva]
MARYDTAASRSLLHNRFNLGRRELAVLRLIIQTQHAPRGTDLDDLGPIPDDNARHANTIIHTVAQRKHLVAVARGLDQAQRTLVLVAVAAGDAQGAERRVHRRPHDGALVDERLQVARGPAELAHRCEAREQRCAQVVYENGADLGLLAGEELLEGFLQGSDDVGADKVRMDIP